MEDEDYIPSPQSPEPAAGGGIALAVKKSVGIFFFLTIYFALICTPFLAASSDPDRNYSRFQIYLADFDGSILGSSMLQFYQVLIILINTALLDSFIQS